MSSSSSSRWIYTREERAGRPSAWLNSRGTPTRGRASSSPGQASSLLFSNHSSPCRRRGEGGTFRTRLVTSDWHPPVVSSDRPALVIWHVCHHAWSSPSVRISRSNATFSSSVPSLLLSFSHEISHHHLSPSCLYIYLSWDVITCQKAALHYNGGITPATFSRKSLRDGGGGSGGVHRVPTTWEKDLPQLPTCLLLLLLFSHISLVENGVLFFFFFRSVITLLISRSASLV